MGGLAAILVGVAAKVGATLVKTVLEGKVGSSVGGAAGDLAGTVIETIATKAGVTPAELPTVPQKDLEKAVTAAEAETPELILAHVRQQEEANRLQLAEMTTEPAWTWAWRPAGMWLLHALIVWYVVLVPVLNLILRLSGASAGLVLVVDVATFITIYMTFVGLYMGGHTAKDFFAKAAEALKGWKGGAA